MVEVLELSDDDPRFSGPTAAADARAFARAVATFARRRERATGPVVLGRGGPSTLAVRNALVQGLVLGGAQVVDVGLATVADVARAASALSAAVTLKLVDDGGVTAVLVALDGPATAKDLAEIRAILDGGDFCAGEGEVVLASPSTLPTARAGTPSKTSAPAPTNRALFEDTQVDG